MMEKEPIAQIIIDCFDDETCDLKHTRNLDYETVVAIIQQMHLILLNEEHMTKQ